MTLIQGITFRDEPVGLDGKHFQDCTFTDCTLEYSGGDLVLERVTMRGCRHVLFGYARQTAIYMRTVGMIDGTSDKWLQYTGRTN